VTYCGSLNFIYLQGQHKLYPIFFAFRTFEKLAKFWLLLNVQKPKVFKLQGGAPAP